MIQRGKIIILILCILCLVISGCAKQDKEQTDLNSKKEEPAVKLTVQDVYPLNVGDFWKFAGQGNEYASFEQRVLYREADRIQLQLNNGGTVMGMIYEFKEGKLMVVYSQEEFYEDENILNRENQMEQIILAEPIEKGNIWESSGRKYVIEDIKALVKTPAGEFTDCIKISNSGEEEEAKSYVFYKPGLGIVKQEYNTGDAQIIAELEEYQIQSAQ